jgi:hypothetical protein
VKLALLLAVAACASSSSTATQPQAGPSAAALAQGRLRVPLEQLTRTDGGAPAIVPDDMTRHRMAEANVVKVSGLFLVCLDAAGAVEAVDVLASTSLPDYDAKIQTRVRQWTFAPFTDETGAKPVCTQLIVEYAQDPKDRPMIIRQ